MTETTARFALPFILPGQAQKELFHNEALALIDAALHPAAEEVRAAPPPDPEPGQCWIVGEGASGDWLGMEGRIAMASGAGWRFVMPREGMAAWDASLGLWRHWTGAGWSEGMLPAAGLVVAGDQVVGPRLPAIAPPAGGAVVDSEARAAIGALIATLMSHGLTE